jgi:hypothetical protein
MGSHPMIITWRSIVKQAKIDVERSNNQLLKIESEETKIAGCPF